jgi:hypothetical protein
MAEYFVIRVGKRRVGRWGDDCKDYKPTPRQMFDANIMVMDGVNYFDYRPLRGEYLSTAVYKRLFQRERLHVPFILADPYTQQYRERADKKRKNLTEKALFLKDQREAVRPLIAAILSNDTSGIVAAYLYTLRVPYGWNQ